MKEDTANALLAAGFCNCCYGGCDCGCVIDCRLVRHREDAGIVTAGEQR